MLRELRRRRAGRSLAARLAQAPWQAVELAADADVPSLLHPEEKAILYWLAREHVTGAGCIVDGGPLLGGSTAPLSAGLRDRTRPVAEPVRIRSYDLFVADEVALAFYDHLIGPDATVGQDLRPLFERNVGPDLLSRVDVFAGDLLDHGHDGTPIEVLFVDVLKSWELNDHVARAFYPALMPGHSVVVHQDWVHAWTPWLHLTMELLGDRFRFVRTAPWGTSVWVCVAPIAPGDVPRDLRAELPDARKLALFDRAVARVSGEERGVLEVARANLMAELGDVPGAAASLDGIERRYPGSDRVTTLAADVRRVRVHGEPRY